jgi:hypothetical protein
MMRVDSNEPPFSSSVILTDTHYSMWRIIGTSSMFNLPHEQLTRQPTLGYATVPTDHWYNYFAPPCSNTVRRVNQIATRYADTIDGMNEQCLI